MDPVTTTIVSAFIVGATAGVTKSGEKLIGDAYAALKSLVTTGYDKATDLLASITRLEEKPESEGRRTLLAEELESAGALDDEQLVAAADEVLRAAEQTGQSIGVDWQDVKAARLSIGKIRANAGAIGFRAARLKITGDITINEIEAGGPPGNLTR